MTTKELHDAQTRDRDGCSGAIAKSTAKNKIIVAGAGTGKSFAFQELLKTKRGGNNLALTFINNLARDLRKDLDSLAESYTFHGYCKKLLHKIPVEGINSNFHYFPKLPKLIEIDASILNDSLQNFEEAFHTLTEDDRIDFYLNRGNYYNAVGHSDSVYRVLKYFQSGRGSLPSFTQIVVDEYQDFNLLEVAFIDELAKTSPVLLAGDDDQAIYNFKNASPYHIRAKATDQDFEKFELPYCSRCTEVIVDAVNDITTKAQSLGKLVGRIPKKYYCFLPDKADDSATNPQIIHASCSTHTKRAPFISKFIEKEIALIPQAEIDYAREKNYPCVLIAGPSHYTRHIYGYLKTKFTNIDYPEEQNQDLDILEGYKILISDENANLGWRIILECSGFAQRNRLIGETHTTRQTLSEVLDEDFKNEHLAIAALLVKIKSGDTLSTDEIKKVVAKCGRPIDAVKKILGISPDDENEAEGEPIDTSVSIKITTINGSKGL